jgi:hypothetical protein
MGILNWLSPKTINAVGDLYTTDKARLEAEKDFTEVAQKPQLAQLEINKNYSLSSIFFNSAWIPLLGWTCGFLILIYYAPQILICTYVWGKEAIKTGIAGKFPMNSNDLLYLIGLLYGVGTHSLIKRN